MYNHRLVLAQQKDRIISILNAAGINSSSYNLKEEFREKFKGEYLLLAIWLDVRGIVPDEYNAAIKKYINEKKIDPSKFIVSKRGVNLNDKLFTDPIEFTEYIHANYPIVELKYEAISENEHVDDVPVLIGNGIKIFEVNNANDARRLVGHDTDWCIGASGVKNMWQSYRSNYESTFFIVFDENPPNPDLRKVALDFAKQRILLTDINNRTGETLTNGWDSDDYFDYLTSKNVNLDATRINSETNKEEKILQNKPITMAEKLEDNILKANIDLKTLKNWLNGIANATIYSPVRSSIYGDDYNDENEYFVYIEQNFEVIGSLYDDRIRSWVYSFKYPEAPYLLSKYIDKGKLLDNEVFDFVLTTNGGTDLINKYVNTGIKIPLDQFEKLKNNKELFKSYLRKQVQVGEQRLDLIDTEVIKYLDLDNLKKVFANSRAYIDRLSKLKKEIDKIDDAIVKTPFMIGSLSPEYFLNRFKDTNLNETQIKLYIALEYEDLLKKNLTVENVKLYLHDIKAIRELISKASSEGYGRLIINEAMSYDNFGRGLSKTVKDFILDNLEKFDLENILKTDIFNFRKLNSIKKDQTDKIIKSDPKNYLMLRNYFGFYEPYFKVFLETYPDFHSQITSDYLPEYDVIEENGIIINENEFSISFQKWIKENAPKLFEKLISKPMTKTLLNYILGNKSKWHNWGEAPQITQEDFPDPDYLTYGWPVVRPETETKNQTSSKSIVNLFKIANELDKKKKYKDSDLVLNYIKRYSNV